MSAPHELGDELADAAACVLGMIDGLQPDFRNGVTDATGTIDEGDVRAGEAIERLRAALRAVGAA